MNKEVKVILSESLAARVDLLMQLNQTNWNDLVTMLLEDYTTKSVENYIKRDVGVHMTETKKNKITDEMTSCAYSISKRVYNCQLTGTEGKFQIHKQSGMNAGSAKDYITNFLSMMKGECYTRTMSTEGTEYFLRNIYKDYGNEFFLLAIAATEKHLKYYNDISGAPSHKRVQILAKLKSELT